MVERVWACGWTGNRIDGVVLGVDGGGGEWSGGGRGREGGRGEKDRLRKPYGRTSVQCIVSQFSTVYSEYSIAKYSTAYSEYSTVYSEYSSVQCIVSTV
jgi:hypothetical protein